MENPNSNAAANTHIKIKQNTKISKTRAVTYCAFFVALMAVGSQLYIPLPFTPVPISFGLFMVLLCGIIHPFLALGSIMAYIALGALGVPVFQGFGATPSLVSYTGGYIWGYIPAVLTSSLSFRYIKKPFWLCIGLFIGVVSCYMLGTLWFILLTDMTFLSALKLCVIPFAPFDLFKVILAAFIGLRVKKAIRM